MLNTYAGLCIGGPKDGQWIVSEHPVLHVMVLTDFRPLLRFDEPPGVQDVMYKTVTYRHECIRPEKGREAFLFIAEGLSLFDAVVRLMENYRPPQYEPNN